MQSHRLYTIGHSNLSISQFIDLLKQSEVSTLVDVRTSPYSRYNPQFNREALTQSLADERIGYRYAGDALGGRPSDASCYKHGKLPDPEADYLHEVDYRAVMTRPWFAKGIAQLLEECRAGRTAIMCSEAKPQECHRHHLIAVHLLETEPECEVLHILSTGDVIKASQIHLSVDGIPPEQLGFAF
jgi:uncharacterized protein (DUF488 family)